MLKHLAMAVMAAMALVTPAFSADILVDNAAPAVTQVPVDWTGFYAGVFVGGHAGRVIEYDCAGLCSGDFDLSGAVGGIDAGFDYQLDNNWVLGGFVQVPLIRPDGSAEVPLIGTFTVEPQFAVTGGIRVGYAVQNLLPYAFVGAEVVRSDVTEEVVPLTSTATHFGVIGGVGVEFALNDNWSIDGRYTYTHLNSADYDFGGGPEGYGENAHNFTLGIHYRF